jgi:hypothetical protein
MKFGNVRSREGDTRIHGLNKVFLVVEDLCVYEGSLRLQGECLITNRECLEVSVDILPIARGKKSLHCIPQQCVEDGMSRTIWRRVGREIEGHTEKYSSIVP